MRFAGEDELHRPRLVVEQTLQAFLIAEEQRAAFVGREAARESDRQNFRIENAIDAADRFRRFAGAFARHADALPHKLDQAQFQFLVRLPKLRVGNIDHAAPEIRVGQMLLPIAQILLVERGELRRHPGLGVNAIGDAGDRNFVPRHAGPDILPKRPADFAVQLAHAVRMPADRAAPEPSC